MAKPRGLGRGFDSLIPTEVAADLPAVVAPTIGDAVHQIDPKVIAPNPHQPRQQFDAAELAGLADSIRQHGILQPLVVSRRDGSDGQAYELIAGERRLRAAKQAGLKQVPVIIRSFGDQQKLELALLENLQRASLNPIETAAAYRKLVAEFNLSLEEIGRRMGKAKSTVANVLRLLQLPVAAQKAVASGAISEAHGRAILAITDSPAAQDQLLQHIVAGGWTVRQAEAFTRDHKAGSAQPVSGSQSAGNKPAATNSTSPEHTQLIQALGNYLGAHVSVQPTAKGGKLVIAYRGNDGLQRIINRIKPDKPAE